MKSLLILFLIFFGMFFVSADLGVQESFELSQISIHAFLENSVNIINATDTWNLQVGGVNLTGLGETICVLDTGVNFFHPDLFGKNVTCNIDCVNKNCIENCSVSDDYGHGTHVAGIVAANGSLKGVAPDANLIGVKVLNSSGGGNFQDLYNAIEWCINSATVYNISVISMSLGTKAPILYSDYCDSSFSPLASLINSAVDANISVIAANGNDGNETHISAPACIANVTAVGWTNDDDSVNSGSNNNNLTDLLAPGTDINSTSYNGVYTQKSGTSMSTPHVAGAFALMNQFLKLNSVEKTINRRESIFISTGKFIGDSLWNKSRINIYAAISYLSNLDVILNDPLNNSYVNSQINFSCNSSLTFGNLENATFYLWNSTDLVYNETVNISGESNFSEFNYSLENLNYVWNCFVEDDAGRSSWAINNFSIVYDNETPEVNLISPIDNYSSSSSAVEFGFNFSDNNIANCSLYVDNVLNATNSSLIGSVGSISTSLSNGNYSWTVNCTDLAGNIGAANETRNFSVNYVAPVIETSSGGGGGSSTRSYSVGETDLERGYTRSIKKGDSLNFNINSGSHSLEVKKIGNVFVELLIESEPQKVSMVVGEEKKISFDNVSYKLLIRLNEIKYNSINLTIKGIDELIFVKPEVNKSDLEKLKDIKIIAFDNETEKEISKKIDGRFIFKLEKLKFYFLNGGVYLIIGIVFGFFIICYFLGKDKKR